MKRLALYAIGGFLFCQPAFAQRVLRKGTTPIEINRNKTISKGAFTLEQVQGNWLEVKRVSIDSKERAAYTDSLMLNITDAKAEVREGMSMNMKGTASIESGRALSVAGDVYSIVTLSQDQMVISDGDFYKTLQLVEAFNVETVGNVAPKPAELSPVKIAFTNIMGKWDVYKKQAKPGFIKPDMYLVSSMNITKNANPTLATGEIVLSQNNQDQKYPCSFILQGDTLQVLANNMEFNFYTYPSGKNEIIFGNVTGVLNFAKKE